MNKQRIVDEARAGLAATLPASRFESYLAEGAALSPEALYKLLTDSLGSNP